MWYCRRYDVSIFGHRVIETLFIEVNINETYFFLILGVIYQPNTQPRSDMYVFITKLADITAKINTETKESYITDDLIFYLMNRC